LRITAAVEVVELSGLLGSGMLMLIVWESWLVTIQADLVPMFPGRFKLSLPVTLLQPCSIWTGLPRDKGALTHHVV